MRYVVRLTVLGLLFWAAPLAAQQSRTLSFADLMQVRQIEQPSISSDGAWIAFTAEPDRGDAEVVVRSTENDTRYVIPRASHPVIARGGSHVVMRQNASLEVRETSDDPPRRGMVILDTSDGSTTPIGDVQSFTLTDDGRWLVYHHFAEATGEDDDEASAGDRSLGTDLVVRDLRSGEESRITEVRAYELAESGTIAYSVASADESRDGLYMLEPGASTAGMIHAEPMGHYGSFAFNRLGHLAFTAATEDEDGVAGEARLMAWRGRVPAELVGASDIPAGWTIPADTDLSWSDDGERVFFGWRPETPADETEEDETGAFDAYDLDAILDGRGVDVWHWQDDRIIPQQKVAWSSESVRTYTAVAHVSDGRVVALSDPDVPDLTTRGSAMVGVAHSDMPYRREALWEGGQRDLYAVDLDSGERSLVAERLRSRGQLSPEGRFIVFYDAGDYHLYDVGAGSTRNLTEELGVSFANEDHDYPQPAPGYGIGGWLEDDAGVFVYDKYDVWVMPTAAGRPPWALTSGREAHTIFRVIDTDPDVDAYAWDDRLLLSAYHDLRKSFGFYEARAENAGATTLLAEDRRFRVVAHADDADRVLYTREAYDEFPDLWVADGDFGNARKVTDVNPQIADFGWGTAELAEWRSLDGTPLQGVVIKPSDYEEGKRYPVLVYYYRFMSDRLHSFNDPSVNHRPSFPIYASDGYVVFLPDVRFEVGRPGFASTKSVVPGVQHLIDIGLADPDRIALHGHSWSGYQTAFMVTQTNLFATAIAGAPVGNMTSAYSGIRLGSGLARQFQYENGQSRLSGNLWEARADYIDNSPIFFADKIETPMLILHGDEDDAVPWEQSIELFLAMKRLDKESVLLQYRGEPHHPQRYANKLDWAVKMKEWVDYYLKDAPAPDWITKGLKYQGR